MKMQIFVAVKLSPWGGGGGGGGNCLQGKEIGGGGGVQERKEREKKEEKEEAPVLAPHWKPAKHMERIYMHGYGLS